MTPHRADRMLALKRQGVPAIEIAAQFETSVREVNLLTSPEYTPQDVPDGYAMLRWIADEKGVAYWEARTACERHQVDTVKVGWRRCYRVDAAFRAIDALIAGTDGLAPEGYRNLNYLSGLLDRDKVTLRQMLMTADVPSVMVGNRRYFHEESAIEVSRQRRRWVAPINSEMEQEIIFARKEGMTYLEIAAALQISEGTVSRVIKRNGMQKKQQQKG